MYPFYMGNLDFVRISMTNFKFCVIEKGNEAKCTTIHGDPASRLFSVAKMEQETFSDLIEALNNSKYPLRWSVCTPDSKKGYKLLKHELDDFKFELIPSTDNLNAKNVKEFLWDGGALIIDLDKKKLMHINVDGALGYNYARNDKSAFRYNECDKNASHIDPDLSYLKKLVKFKRDMNFERFDINMSDMDDYKEAYKTFVDTLVHTCDSDEVRIPQRVSECADVLRSAFEEA
jgi:hypothetical protein